MTARARRGVALTAILVAGAAAALPAHAAMRHGGKTRTVGVESDFYAPTKLTIHLGDRVKWVWRGAGGLELHDVYVDAGPAQFHSPTQAAGTFTKTFKKAGTYKLYCTQHEEDMTMTLVVKKLKR